MSALVSGDPGSAATPASTASLGQRAGRGALWFSATHWLDRGLQMLRLVLVAALLGPEQVGLVAVAVFCVGALEVTTQLGVQQALVQRREVSRRELDTGWTLGVLRGCLLAGLLAAAAGPLAGFFHSPSAEPILRLLALAPLLSGLNSVGLALIERELAFARRMVYQLGGTIADLALSVGLVWLLKDPWGLALGILGGHLVRLALSYLLHPARARPRLERSAMAELLGFGRWVSASWLLVFVAYQGAEAMVGRLLGAGQLAIFQTASRLGDIPGEVSGALGVVAMPAYARLQDRQSALGAAYLRSVRVVSFATLGLATTLAALAEPLVELLFRPDWRSMTGALAILALAGGLRSVLSLGSPAFLGANAPRHEVAMQAARVALLAVSIVPSIQWWGIEGAAWSNLLALGGALVFWLRSSCRVMNLSWQSLAQPLLASGLLAAASGAVILATTRDPTIAPLTRLLLGGAAGAAIYLLGTALFVRIAGYGIWEDLRLILRLLNPSMSARQGTTTSAVSTSGRRTG